MYLCREPYYHPWRYCCNEILWFIPRWFWKFLWRDILYAVIRDFTSTLTIWHRICWKFDSFWQLLQEVFSHVKQNCEFIVIKEIVCQWMKMNIFIIMICAYTGFTMFLKWITTEDYFTGFQKFDNNSHIVNNKYSRISQDFKHLTIVPTLWTISIHTSIT